MPAVAVVIAGAGRFLESYGYRVTDSRFRGQRFLRAIAILWYRYVLQNSSESMDIVHTIFSCDALELRRSTLRYFLFDRTYFHHVLKRCIATICQFAK